MDNSNVLAHSWEICINFEREHWARIVMNTLEVDKELRPSLVQRSMTVENSNLKVSMSSSELRMLRTSISSFFDMILLATRTINQFG